MNCDHGIVCTEITYKTGLRANIYRPYHSRTVPVCICLAGGGYLAAPKIESPYPADLVTRDIAAICPMYSAVANTGGTVASEGEDAVDDMHDLMTWLAANKGTYNLSDTDVGFFGISAGGQTALRYVYGDHGNTKPANIGGVFAACSNFILKSGGVAQVTGDRTVIETGDPEATFVFMDADERYEPADSAAMTGEFTAEGVAFIEYELVGAHGDFSANTTLSSGKTTRRELVDFMLTHTS